MDSQIYDLLVIGGGINGTGIARDATGRGLSVMLCEKDDLAQHTSSASTKLVHGGLRYLEYYEFGLVRKALQEREVLMRAAPHIISPLRFVMPHDPAGRPAWLIRTGLFLYDHLAKREMLPGAESIKLSGHPTGLPLKAGFKRGFAYSDGWVQDARLVVLNAQDATERGAAVLTRTACIAARREGSQWHCRLRHEDGREQEVVARALVNAAGPWVNQFLGLAVSNTSNSNSSSGSSKKVRLVKGSHIVVKKLFDHPYAYIFQNPDKRIIFAIPYEDDFTLIGTTDIEYHDDPATVAIDGSEIDYLCAMSNRYFEQQIGPQDVVATFSGVRPLLEDDSADAAGVTRDYSLELHESEGAPLLSVFGGKITTYRKLAEQALDMLAPRLGNTAPAWTDRATLPGGDLPNADFAAFLLTLECRYPWLPAGLRKRYANTYGSRINMLLGDATAIQDLGLEIAPGLFEAEARYLVDVEWARSADDILWRRTKLRLHMPAAAIPAVEQWLVAYLAVSTDQV